MKKKLFFLILAVIVIVGMFFFLKANFSNQMYIEPVIIVFGPFEIHWYGVLIASGIIISYLIGRKMAISEGIDEEHVAEAVIVGVFTGIIGARLYYVFSRWDVYSTMPGEIFKTWHGGMAIHGGIIGAAIGVYIYTKIRRKCTFTFFQGFDIAAVLFPLAQAIGRWGNFCNHEAYGKPTDLPWKMYIPPSFRMPGYEAFEYFHPTFLYESVWNVGVFVFLFWYYRNKRKNYGEMIAFYMIFYSIARFFIEGLRLDSLYWGDLRAAQVISVILIVAGIALFFLVRKFGRKVSCKEGSRLDARNKQGSTK